MTLPNSYDEWKNKPLGRRFVQLSYTDELLPGEGRLQGEDDEPVLEIGASEPNFFVILPALWALLQWPVADWPEASLSQTVEDALDDRVSHLAIQPGVRCNNVGRNLLRISLSAYDALRLTAALTGLDAVILSSSVNARFGRWPAPTGPYYRKDNSIREYVLTIRRQIRDFAVWPDSAVWLVRELRDPRTGELVEEFHGPHLLLDRLTFQPKLKAVKEKLMALGMDMSGPVEFTLGWHEKVKGGELKLTEEEKAFVIRHAGIPVPDVPPAETPRASGKAFSPRRPHPKPVAVAPSLNWPDIQGDASLTWAVINPDQGAVNQPVYVVPARGQGMEPGEGHPPAGTSTEASPREYDGVKPSEIPYVAPRLVRVATPVFELFQRFAADARGTVLEQSGWHFTFTPLSVTEDNPADCFRVVAVERVVRLFPSPGDQKVYYDPKVKREHKPQPLCYVVPAAWQAAIEQVWALGKVTGGMGKTIPHLTARSSAA